ADEGTPSAREALAQLNLYDEAKLGVELICRALVDWDAFMLQITSPSPAMDHYCHISGHNVAWRIVVVQEANSSLGCP
ncbi:hypothetical protein U1Q18_014380, partial [Sarracenia purpurea var. burkii]